MDWNEDGQKDLLVGDAFGYITLFNNAGTDSSPKLTNAGYIKVGNRDLNVGGKAAPCVNDWNEDGLKDLVVGQEDGRVALFINQRTNAAPTFNQVQYVKANGIDLDVSPSYFDRCAPEIVDLNRDGLKDLILGQQDGTVVFYANSGTNANPQFTNSVPLKAGNFNLRVGAYSRVDIVDWDEDGDLDLLCGDETCHITLFRNTTISAVEPPVVTSEVPDSPVLLQNYPNPFNATTRLEFFIPQSGPVTLDLVNLQGQMHRQLVNHDCEAGWQQMLLDATQLSSGIYLVRLTSQGMTRNIKICVLR